jgi:hypothetical protein
MDQADGAQEGAEGFSLGCRHELKCYPTLCDR